MGIRAGIPLRPYRVTDPGAFVTRTEDMQPLLARMLEASLSRALARHAIDGALHEERTEIAREVGSRTITCNAVAPGFIETAMTATLGDEFKQSAIKQIPLGRVGSPEDVANAVAFLASEEASYITGHVLAVNGGMYM